MVQEKTTFILHLNGILGNLDDSIYINNLSINEDNLKKIREKVGIVFQDPDDQLFMPTVLEDVMFGPKNFGYTNEEAESKAIEALEKVKMKEFLNKPSSPFELWSKKKSSNSLCNSNKP